MTEDHVEVGVVDGVPILLDRRYVAADLRIVTGFVEPHFFAGWSGGPKAVCPGLAATSTILEAHSPSRIADRRSTWLTTVGNPVHEFVTAATALCPPDLARRRHPGHRSKADRGLRRPASRRPPRRMRVEAGGPPPPIVDGPFDVVVTTNGGHPLDRNLYQAVKGLAAAERVVIDGGTVILAAACLDGIPRGGAFARLLAGAAAATTLARPGGPFPSRRLAGPGPRPGTRAGRGPGVFDRTGRRRRCGRR